MSNYVYNRVVGPKEVLEKYFIEFYQEDDDKKTRKYYISFFKLFGVSSYEEYSEKVGGRSYCYTTSLPKITREDKSLYEIRFQTKWEYPIRAILKAIELSNDIIWFAAEEGCIYISKFYWQSEVKEDVLFIEDEYYSWMERNYWIETYDLLDESVWFFLPNAKGKWINWENQDGFKRYLDIEAVFVSYPFNIMEDINAVLWQLINMLKNELPYFHANEWYLNDPDLRFLLPDGRGLKLSSKVLGSEAVILVEIGETIETTGTLYEIDGWYYPKAYKEIEEIYYDILKCYEIRKNKLNYS
ncbi:MAG TPA: hypothetical protein PLT36_01495 [Erysipelotrichaceae bacterium]|nr:hypothetical protein [Erysipelotrichaceae bacterium]HQA84502.1 hypothetical protein [Erysipelotrichaceae bacterium]